MKAADLDRRADEIEKQAKATADAATKAARRALGRLAAAEADEARAEQLRAAAAALRENDALCKRIVGLDEDITDAQERITATQQIIEQAQERAARATAEFDEAADAGDVDRATALAAVNRTTPDVLAAQQAILDRDVRDVANWTNRRRSLTYDAGNLWDKAEAAVALAESDSPWPGKRPSVLARLVGLLDPADQAQLLQVVYAATLTAPLGVLAATRGNELDAVKARLRPAPMARPGLYGESRGIAARR